MRASPNIYWSGNTGGIKLIHLKMPFPTWCPPDVGLLFSPYLGSIQLRKADPDKNKHCMYVWESLFENKKG